MDRKTIDTLAAEHGFVFRRALDGYENRLLYHNEGSNRNRIYDSNTGELIHEYTPKNNGSAQVLKFVRPEEVPPNQKKQRWNTSTGKRHQEIKL